MNRMKQASAWCSVVAGLCVAAPAAFAAKKVDPAQEALDRADITNVMMAALFHHDNHDDQAFVALFAPDGMVRIEDPKRPVVVKAAEFTKGAPGGAPPAGDASPPINHHLLTNVYVQITDATHAKLHGYYTLITPEGSGFVIKNIAVYDNDFVKLDGKWMLETYHITFGKVKLD